jgi:threonine aldolase
MIVDLRSDTVTRPTKEMLEAMFAAKVGDDVFGEDETVSMLEKKAAALFGKEAGLFCPSGTMTNQIAIKVHTQPGDEVICDKLSHIYIYEGGGIASNALASVALLEGDRGRFTSEQILENIRKEDVHFPRTSLVSIENTVNRGGGACWDMNEIKKIAAACTEHTLQFHLDGARIFNALVANKETAKNMGAQFDSVSVCLSKGLGAPVGSVLLGTKDFIKKARRVRKVFGGGMRQAGYLAAAGIYALDNNINRINEDHSRAKQLGEAISKLSAIEKLHPVETNIVLFTMPTPSDAQQFIGKLAENDIKAIAVGKSDVRFVTHLDFTDDMLEKVIKTIKKI